MNVLLLIILLIGHENKIVGASVYNATKSQCDYNPLVTASGTIISTKELLAGKIRYISISRDLLKKCKYGSYINITCSNTYYNGNWLVVDTMNKRYRNKVDFLQHTKDKNVPPKKIIIWIKN